MTGFCITAAAPSANPLVKSARIEMMTTGTCCSVGTFLIRVRKSHPSILGSAMSSVISDSGCFAARSSPSSADVACSTVNPSASSWIRMRPAEV